MNKVEGLDHAPSRRLCGWPADKGGPMFYGDMVGAQAVLDVMEKLGAEDPEFAPAELLRDLAKNGGKFTEIDTGGLKV